MNRLKEITNLCNGSVTVKMNPHKDECMIVEQYFENERNRPNDEKIFKMVELDSIVHVQANSSYPIVSHSVYHYDIELAIDEMFEIIKTIS